MKFVFAKMGLETAATEIFGKLEKGLEPRLNLEELAPGQATSVQPVTNGFVSFCSAPVFQEGVRLRAVLKLRKSVLDAYYSLQRRRIAPGFDTVPSLIEAAVAEYLRLCPDLIQSADTDRLMVRLGREVEEILRMAAARLMFNPVLVSGYGETHARRLFYDCNSISYLRYERAESNGRVLLASREHPNVRPLLTRRSPLPMSDHRAVRKLLELASDDVCVMSDGYQVYGLAAIQGRYDESRQDLYSIRFVSQSNWEFYHGERLMMRVLDSRPELPDIRLESRFKFELLSLFPLLGTERLEDLWNLVQAAGASRRGAIVVIAEDASEEASRLEVGSTRVEPTPMSPELMKRVCAIDGAVLIDTSGTCHSIGVILDGLAASTGDSSRGARYNSAVRFARSTKTPCLLAVVSEDGGTELLSSTAGQ